MVYSKSGNIYWNVIDFQQFFKKDDIAGFILRYPTTILLQASDSQSLHLFLSLLTPTHLHGPGILKDFMHQTAHIDH